MYRYCIGGKKYTPKVFSALKTQVSQQAKKRFGVYQKAYFQGKKKENTYTPKRLQGVCGRPLRAVLVYRFLPPIVDKIITHFFCLGELFLVSFTETLQHDILGEMNYFNVMIAVLSWKERIFWLQLQLFCPCYVEINCCNVTPFLYRILSFQNIICNTFVPNGTDIVASRRELLHAPSCQVQCT